MSIDGRISQANGRLKSARVGVQIQAIGDRLYLRATLPPKPGSNATHNHQQRIALGWRANPAGVKLAEAEARKVGALVDVGEFCWDEYVKIDIHTPETVGEWVERFEEDYFTRRDRTPQSETTWRHDYLKVFKTLDANDELSPDLLKRVIATTKPDTRTRKRFCDVLSRLATFAGIEADFKPLIGSYSPRKATPRNLPSDRAIAENRDKISSTSWQWAYGMLAAYGLRNHELFYLDFSEMPVLLIRDGKTGSRRVWPIYPEWVSMWNLAEPIVPTCSGRDNSALGNRVTHAFKRYELPFTPYDLRHCWAVRSLEFGMPVELAAQQMGHSVQVHCNTYHAWITADVHRRAYEALMGRSNRPLPPHIN